MSGETDSKRWAIRDAPDSTSTSLLQRVKSHDPEAWRRLVDLYGPVVYRWCRQWGVVAEDAADVFQEVFSAVAAHVADFRRDQPGDSFHGWLWTITRNKVRDLFRRRQGRPEAQGGTDSQVRLSQIPDDASASLLANPRSDDRIGLAQRALTLIRAEIADRTWEAFWRLTVEGEPGAAVAEDLEMSIQAVYQAKCRVLKQVRLQLGEFPA
jgi:RNA polymerase sigma-70 factor (ECF subfamily)